MSGSSRVRRTAFGAFLLGILAFVLFFYFNFRTVQVNGPSMEPTFRSGQRLLISTAYWLVGPVHRDDFVVVRVPDTGETLIKRVKGMPGDVIDFKDVPLTWSLSQGEYKVPDGTYYILGDNRPVSQDSRELGPVELSNVVGKVVIYGTEPWLFGILAASVFAVAASCVTAALESRAERRVL